MRRQLFKTFLGLMLGFTLMFNFSGLALAHVLKENNGVSAVLHIPPDDNPLAAQLTSLDFSFSSDSGNFSLEHCSCRVEVQNNGKILQSVQLERPLGGGTLDSVASVRFPTVGVYDVIVKGASDDFKFQPFTLDYLVRVAGTSSAASTTASNKGGVVILSGTGSFILLILGAYAIIEHGGRYKRIVK